MYPEAGQSSPPPVLYAPTLSQKNISAQSVSSTALPGPMNAYNFKDYAALIEYFSKLPAEFGQNYRQLSQYLNDFVYRIKNYEPSSKTEDFLYIYDLTAANSTTSARGDLLRSLSDNTIASVQTSSGGPHRFSNCKEFAAYQIPPLDTVTGQLVFLRGYPSPEWVALVASKYGVDPELFRRFIDFRTAGDRSINYSTPSLPSANWNLIQLPVITIGSREVLKHHVTQVEIDQLRKDAAEKMKQYQHALLVGNAVPVASSVVRHYHLLDETHYALEQRISICIAEGDKRNRRGWNAIIWTDGGLDLFDRSLPGPWCTSPVSLKSRGTALYPIVQQKPMIALVPQKVFPELFKDSTAAAGNAVQNLGPSMGLDTKESASLLHLNYGRSLRSNLMACDTFYALTEVFELAASSQNQFLNLLDAKLTDCVSKINNQEHEVLNSLTYIKEILHDQTRQIQGLLASISNAKLRKWPKMAVTDRDQERAVRTREAVVEDYTHLKAVADDLQTRCNDAISTLMSSISIAESKHALLQQKRISTLTLLAFIFVPMSFTTSFFGMNFKELSPDATLSIWVWFVVTVSVFALIAVGYYTRIFTLLRRGYQWWTEKLHENFS